MVGGLSCADYYIGSPHGGQLSVGGMGFEELLDQAGGFGPFQLRNVALLALPRILLPMNFLLPIFLAAVPAHHCVLPGAPANFSQDMWLEAHLPRESGGTLSSCFRFTYTQAPNTTLGGDGQSPGELQGEPSTVPCPQGWEYDHSEFSSTIATEWDLVCEQKGLNRATSTFFFVGVLVGAVAFGYLSDRFGRRRLLLVAYVSALGMGLASAASVSYIMFVITRTLTGTALAGFTIIVMPLELEWLDVGHRTVAGVLSSTFWTGGVMLLALVGYLIRDWRWLLLAVTLPCVPGIISLWWVPESARWLLTQGRVEEAHRYLLCCARLNGRPVGPAQSSSRGAGGPKTFLLGSVSDPAAPTHLAVLHDGVVWSEFLLLRPEPGHIGAGAERVPDAAAVRGRGAARQAAGLLVGAPRWTPPHTGRDAAGHCPYLGLQAAGAHREGVLEHRPGRDRERVFRSCLHHCLLVHLGAVPYCAQTDRDGADGTGRPAWGLFGSTGGLAGWSMAVTAQAHLWGDCPAGCLHCPPPARDKEGTAARDHPGCGGEEPSGRTDAHEAGP
ncbi:solute carrier family 22 member 7 isoform X2 [Myotis daubentonii]|uniref:solute carrier family 22 member 7 isoform X2 n=1 Tax=Myotis daubentonii TaxID=98922 RepID=UPI002873828F|nr:solute carrier family 22 member 7 isoform X2 [Myotis daubentonii]